MGYHDDKGSYKCYDTSTHKFSTSFHNETDEMPDMRARITSESDMKLPNVDVSTQITSNIEHANLIFPIVDDTQYIDSKAVGQLRDELNTFALYCGAPVYPIDSIPQKQMPKAIHDQIEQINAYLASKPDADGDYLEMELLNQHNEHIFNQDRADNAPDLFEPPVTVSYYQAHLSFNSPGKFNTVPGADRLPPKNEKDFLNHPQAREYREADRVEMAGIFEQGVLKVVKLSDIPQGATILPMMLIRKCKKDGFGNIIKYKSRCVILGNLDRTIYQKWETYAGTQELEHFRMIAAICLLLDWKMINVDIVQAFLYAPLPEGTPDIYVRLPKGFNADKKNTVNHANVCLTPTANGHWIFTPSIDESVMNAQDDITNSNINQMDKNTCAKLMKGLYGHMCAPHWWQQELTKTLLADGYKQLKCSKPIFIKFKDDKLYIVTGTFVDDLQIIGSEEAQQIALADLERRYNVAGGTLMTWHLGMTIEHRETDKIFLIKQEQHVDDLLARIPYECPIKSLPIKAHLPAVLPNQPCFDETKPYRSILGAVMHIQKGTRPDIACAVSCLASYSNNYQQTHWNALLGLIGYLRGTKHFVLIIGKIPDRLHRPGGMPKIPRDGIVIYADSDYAGDHTRRSRGSLVCFWHYSILFWSSKLFKCIAQSTYEAEVVITNDGNKHALGVIQIDKEFFPNSRRRPALILNDNEAAVGSAHGIQKHARSKHIDTKHFAMQDSIADGST